MEMVDVEAQNGINNGGIARNAGATDIFKKANRPVTLKVGLAFIIVLEMSIKLSIFNRIKSSCFYPVRRSC